MSHPQSYGRLLARINGLSGRGFRRWLFLPGMGFLATEKWWGGGGQRSRPHEGVDFCLYEDQAGHPDGLAAGCMIPAAHDGRVVSIHDDFLGQTVWLRHGQPDGDGRCLHTAYGHLVPASGLAVGATVAVGAVVGAVADPASRTLKISPHLHFTVARIVCCPAVPRLDWSLVHDLRVVQLLDPLAFF